MIKFLLVLLGGAIGTGCRFGLSNLVVAVIGLRQFPFATFLVNITGSFAIGFLAEWFDGRDGASPELRAALLVGVLGGYTTFSSFSLETLNLLRDGALTQALLYPVASVILGLIAVWGGVQAARLI